VFSNRLRTKEKDLVVTEKKLLAAESQVNELQARLNDAINQRRHWEEEYNVSTVIQGWRYHWNWGGHVSHNQEVWVKKLEIATCETIDIGLRVNYLKCICFIAQKPEYFSGRVAKASAYLNGHTTTLRNRIS
jgi:hypothetical protein